MIEELEVKGFRSLREVRWKPGRLNVLIGPNGSGKSNLLHALSLLQSAAEGELPREILKLGGIGPLLWDGQASSLSWHLLTHPLDGPLFTYDLKLVQLGSTSSYRVEEERLTEEDDDLQFHRSLRRSLHKVYINDGEDPTWDVDSEDLQEDQPLLFSLGTPFGGRPHHRFRKGLRQWMVYHDMRVDREALIRQAAVARFEKQIAADGQNLIPVLHTLYTGDRTFKKSLDAAMRAAFGTDYEELVFPPAADQRIQLRLRWRSLKTEQSAANLSDGTLRFLLLIAILANPEPGDLIAIDEPETGLHPNMLPIIAELATEASERTQVILTTHSPQFLDAFTGEPPTTTVAEWVDGETKLSVLDGEELRRWLEHYSLGAMFRSGELEGLA